MKLVSIIVFSAKLNNSLSAYYNTISGKLVKDSSPKWVNSGKLETKGIEWILDYTEVDYSLYFNYTYTISQDQDGKSIDEISDHSANAGILYAFNTHWELMFRANYLGKQKNPKVIATTNSDTIDDATVFNTQLSYYDFHQWDIHLQARNLTDEEYYHSSNLGPDRYRQPQQNLMLKAQYRF